MPPIHNRFDYNSIRRKLRRSMTEPEVILWSCIKDRGVLGYKFRRQHGIGPFVVDFYCPQLRLVIEFDGAQHGEPGTLEYDEARTAYMGDLNIAVLRFWNGDIFTNLSGVLDSIEGVVRERAVLLDLPTGD